MTSPSTFENQPREQLNFLQCCAGPWCEAEVDIKRDNFQAKKIVICNRHPDNPNRCHWQCSLQIEQEGDCDPTFKCFFCVLTTKYKNLANRDDCIQKQFTANTHIPNEIGIYKTRAF